VVLDLFGLRPALRATRQPHECAPGHDDEEYSSTGPPFERPDS
jgi:hypothetical protein